MDNKKEYTHKGVCLDTLKGYEAVKLLDIINAYYSSLSFHERRALLQFLTEEQLFLCPIIDADGSASEIAFSSDI